MSLFETVLTHLLRAGGHVVIRIFNCEWYSNAYSNKGRGCIVKTFVQKLILIGMVILSVGAFADNQQAAAGQFSASQVSDIQKIVHDYLIKNPDVLVEASQALQNKMQAEQQQEAMTAIKANTKDLFADEAAPVAGNPQGDVTMVEFFDYQCGHCKAMNDVVQGIISKNKNLKVIFKELPIFGGNSQYAAKAALAVHEIAADKYYAFHDALLAQTNPMDKTKVIKTARAVGLSAAQIKHMEQKMDEPAIDQQIKANFKLAQALKLAGTPAFIIANKTLDQFQFIPGATSADGLQQAIKAVQQEQQSS